MLKHVHGYYAFRDIFGLFQGMTQESDILVNRVVEQHECQTIRQQWSESAHCACEGATRSEVKLQRAGGSDCCTP